MENSKNKVAIVVGGTSGIGKATADQLLANDVIVHIVGRNIDKVADQANLHKHKVDISNSQDLETLINTIDSLEDVDYLVNAS